jgi:hypothetical protein
VARRHSNVVPRQRGSAHEYDALTVFESAFVLQCSARAAPTITAMEDGEGFYYFQVGDAIDGRRDDLIAMDGKLVEDNEDLSRVRKFATMRAAKQFYAMMEGRYGGQRLLLRSAVVRRTGHR